MTNLINKLLTSKSNKGCWFIWNFVEKFKNPFFFFKLNFVVSVLKWQLMLVNIKLQLDLKDITYFYFQHETFILNSFYSLPLTYPLWNCGFALTAARNFYSFHLFYDYSCVNQPTSHYYVFQLKRQALISKVKTIPYTDSIAQFN